MTSVNGDFRSTSTYLPLPSKNRDLTKIQSKMNEIAKDQFGNTVLHRSCCPSFETGLINFYSKNPHNLLSKNNYGNLPLHILSMHDTHGHLVMNMITKHPDITSELLTSQNNLQKTPIDNMLDYRRIRSLKKVLSFLNMQHDQSTSKLLESTSLAPISISLVQEYLNPLSEIVQGLNFKKNASTKNLDYNTLKLIRKYSKTKSLDENFTTKLNTLRKYRNLKQYLKRKARKQKFLNPPNIKLSGLEVKDRKTFIPQKKLKGYVTIPTT